MIILKGTDMRLNKMLLLVALSAVAVPVYGTAGAKPAQSGERGAPQIPPPPAGLGQIVFYRSSIMGALISCKVHEGNKVVNHLPPGKYFILQTTPGIHSFYVKSETKDVIRLEVEEGETQYVRCSITTGIGIGRPNLSPQSREDFEGRGKHLKLLPPLEDHDAGAAH